MSFCLSLQEAKSSDAEVPSHARHLKLSLKDLHSLYALALNRCPLGQLGKFVQIRYKVDYLNHVKALRSCSQHTAVTIPTAWRKNKLNKEKQAKMGREN